MNDPGTATWLYAVTIARSLPASGLTGVDGFSVRSIRIAAAECTDGVSLSAWVSEAPADGGATVARVREHDHVVSAAHETGHTPLAVRFGQHFPSDAELQRALAPRTGTLASALSAVEGCDEWRVVGVPLQIHTGPDLMEDEKGEQEFPVTPGRQRVQLARQRLQQNALLNAAVRALQGRVDSTLGELAVDSRAELTPGAADCTLAILAPRAAATAVHARITSLLPDLMSDHQRQPLLLGPMAPWTFATVAS